MRDNKIMPGDYDSNTNNKSYNSPRILQFGFYYKNNFSIDFQPNIDKYNPSYANHIIFLKYVLKP